MVKYQLRHGNDLLAWDSLRGCDVSVFICHYQSSIDLLTDRPTHIHTHTHSKKHSNRQTHKQRGILNKQMNKETKLRNQINI